MDKGLKCDLPNFAARKFCPLLFHSFSIKEGLSGMLVGKDLMMAFINSGIPLIKLKNVAICI